MSTIEKLSETIARGNSNPQSNATTLKSQQDYYKKLVEKGIARPDKYNIKNLSLFD